jgi:hypothetical protein
LYWKLVIVAASTDIVHVALDTTRPGAAEASLGVTAAFFFLPPGLADGEALSVAVGLPPEAEADAVGVAGVLGSVVGTGAVEPVAVGTAVAVGLGVGDADGVGAADESDGLGVGLGLGEEPRQKTTRTQV